MSNINKQAVQAVADLKAGYTIGHADVAILNELARIALASLEAEPVGFIARHKETGKFGSYLHPKADWFKNGEYEVLNAYSTPPAPVSVPDEVTAEDCPAFIKYDLTEVDEAWARGFNACRAAMLHGGENAESPSGNSQVIHDGWVLVPVEPTEDMIVNGFESEPDESFSDEREWEAYDAMSGCQQAAHRARLCWSAMIASRPKLKHDLT